MALASVAVLNPKPVAHVTLRALRRVPNGEPDARLDDVRRLRDVLEIFVEAARFGRARAPARNSRLDADDRDYDRARLGHGTFRRVDDDAHELGIAGRVARPRTSQTEASKGGVR